ncbi:Hypothetical protein ORPV_1102 [Orpheovirus IHUMI-LCC2]|uniref:Uncharacterized protein n=1 Tax=Orpheovirus IHUMI-LCC2 TaxID=2023057 RepID=A0A2I2L665_9VIRU|nr:Hypothetical protein ORPV_1102 [Orpheovirus IHUMI-LCC2]SNW63006.1 Hypothetical protein ORPV_1102 [Orpheovirus IHUMI-LCC2]
MDFLRLPNKNQKDTLPFDINNYIKTQYENKKKIWMLNFAGDELKNMLNAYCDELNGRMKFYNNILSEWCNKLNKKYEDGEKFCNIDITLYGPDVYYNSDQEQLLNHAIDNLLWMLGSKGYSYTCKDDTKKYQDFMDGACTIGSKIITVQLK